MGLIFCGLYLVFTVWNWRVVCLGIDFGVLGLGINCFGVALLRALLMVLMFVGFYYVG